jgi:hypothetical protein
MWPFVIYNPPMPSRSLTTVRFTVEQLTALRRSLRLAMKVQHELLKPSHGHSPAIEAIRTAARAEMAVFTRLREKLDRYLP